MVPSTLLLVFAFLTIYSVVRSIRRYYALKAFGGHWSAGWSRLWLLKTQSSGYMNKTFTEINRKYGEYSHFFSSLGLVEVTLVDDPICRSRCTGCVLPYDEQEALIFPHSPLSNDS